MSEPAPPSYQPYQPHQPYQPVAVPARIDPLPSVSVEFHQMFRTASAPWWKGALAIVAFVFGYVVISTVFTAVAFAIDAGTGRISFQDLQAGRIELTPAVLLATNLGNIAAIPLSLLLQWALYGQPVRWSHSVVGYIRWRLVARTAVFVGPVWLLLVFLPSLLSAGGGSFGWESVGLLLIVLLTTPLQAAGEEYGARGLISRAAGSWAADPRIALLISTVVSAAVFAYAHAAQDPWLVVFYFGFGVLMSLLVWRSGGLEVSSVVHGVHNLAAFGAVILAGQTPVVDRSAGTGGPVVLLFWLLIGGVLAVVWWRGPKEGVQRVFQPRPADLAITAR